jgi:hypothetical protein
MIEVHITHLFTGRYDTQRPTRAASDAGAIRRSDVRHAIEVNGGFERCVGCEASHESIHDFFSPSAG